MVFQFRATASNTTGCAQVRRVLACQPCTRYLLPVNGFLHKPPSGREVASRNIVNAMTEGACGISIYSRVILLPCFFSWRTLLHPRYARELPPGGSLLYRHYLNYILHAFFVYFSAHRHSLYGTPPRWRGFRLTKNRFYHRFWIAKAVFYF